MLLTDQQEEFSYAYVHAVATVAGVGVVGASIAALRSAHRPGVAVLRDL